MRFDTAVTVIDSNSTAAIRPVTKVAQSFASTADRDDQNLPQQSTPDLVSDLPRFKPPALSPSQLQMSSNRLVGHHKLLLYSLDMDVKNQIDIRV